jgi:hypothetical protein
MQIYGTKIGVKDKYSSLEEFQKAGDLWKEENLYKTTTDSKTTGKEPGAKPNPRNVLKKADVKDKTIGTKLSTKEVDKGDRTQKQFEEVPIYTNRYNRQTKQMEKVITGYKQQEVKGSGGDKILTEKQNREAVATTKGDKANKDLDQNVVISSQGDKDQVQQAVDEQLEAQKKQGKTINKS